MTKQKKQSTESAVREIRRRTRRKFSPDEKIRIVLEGLRGEISISELARKEGIAVKVCTQAVTGRRQEPKIWIFVKILEKLP